MSSLRNIRYFAEISVERDIDTIQEALEGAHIAAMSRGTEGAEELEQITRTGQFWDAKETQDMLSSGVMTASADNLLLLRLTASALQDHTQDTRLQQAIEDGVKTFFKPLEDELDAQNEISAMNTGYNPWSLSGHLPVQLLGADEAVIDAKIRALKNPHKVPMGSSTERTHDPIEYEVKLGLSARYAETRQPTRDALDWWKFNGDPFLEGTYVWDPEAESMMPATHRACERNAAYLHGKLQQCQSYDSRFISDDQKDSLTTQWQMKQADLDVLRSIIQSYESLPFGSSPKGNEMISFATLFQFLPGDEAWLQSRLPHVPEYCRHGADLRDMRAEYRMEHLLNLSYRVEILLLMHPVHFGCTTQ